MREFRPAPQRPPLHRKQFCWMQKKKKKKSWRAFENRALTAAAIFLRRNHHRVLKKEKSAANLRGGGEGWGPMKRKMNGWSMTRTAPSTCPAPIRPGKKKFGLNT